ARARPSALVAARRADELSRRAQDAVPDPRSGVGGRLGRGLCGGAGAERVGVARRGRLCGRMAPGPRPRARGAGGAVGPAAWGEDFAEAQVRSESAWLAEYDYAAAWRWARGLAPAERVRLWNRLRWMNGFSGECKGPLDGPESS